MLSWRWWDLTRPISCTRKAEYPTNVRLGRKFIHFCPTDTITVLVAITVRKVWKCDTGSHWVWTLPSRRMMDPSCLENVAISEVNGTTVLNELNVIIPENVVPNGTHPDPDGSAPVIYDIMKEKSQDLSVGSDFSEVVNQVDPLQSDHEERYNYCKII